MKRIDTLGGSTTRVHSHQNLSIAPSFNDPSLLNLGFLSGKPGRHLNAKFSSGCSKIDVGQRVVCQSDAYNIQSIVFSTIKKRKLHNIS
jgi:hypothetical protein